MQLHHPTYIPFFSIFNFRDPNGPTPIGTNWPQYTAKRGEYIGLSPNMTVRYKMRPNKMVLWNEFLPSLGETVEPTTSSDVPTATTKPDDKGITIKSRLIVPLFCLILFCVFVWFWFRLSRVRWRILISSTCKICFVYTCMHVAVFTSNIK